MLRYIVDYCRFDLLHSDLFLHFCLQKVVRVFKGREDGSEVRLRSSVLKNISFSVLLILA